MWNSRRAGALLGLLLAGTFTLRVWNVDQPIVENYVGRQVPTAMVARNLERGKSWLRPQLDTGPFPNLFVVEPPLFEEMAVVVRKATGWPLSACGRVVSAFGMTLAAWGLFGLVLRREGKTAALFAVAAFAVFPITVRYGRAFQPDALMLGCLVAGLRCWDEREAGGSPGWLVAGVLLVGMGLALKVISAYILIPLFFVMRRNLSVANAALATAVLLPAAIWYVHASVLLHSAGGSNASVDSAAIWWNALLPTAWLQADTYILAARFLLIRAFTPIGFLLAGGGIVTAGWASKKGSDEENRSDRLWVWWALSATIMLAALASKAHHEYYWLALAPAAAVGCGRVFAGLWGRKRSFGLATLMALMVVGGLQVRSTWVTPREWIGLEQTAQEVQRVVPPGALVVAPEALLYESDRRGCRLEVELSSVRRAVGEWDRSIRVEEPLALIEFYRFQGAEYFADLAPVEPEDSQRRSLHESIRNKYRVVIDNDAGLVVILKEKSPPLAFEGRSHVGR